jgi:uncharacterized protein (TIGR03546 family)
MVVRLILKALKALNSNDSVHQLALGFGIGLLWGMSPLLSLHAVILLLMIYLFNVNITFAMVAGGLAKLLTPFITKIAHFIGYSLLVEADVLKGFWTKLYNLPFIPWSHFYNTVVLGNFVIGIILILPLYFIIKSGVSKYRKTYKLKLEKSKWMVALKKTSLYKWFSRALSVKDAIKGK